VVTAASSENLGQSSEIARYLHSTLVEQGEQETVLGAMGDTKLGKAEGLAWRTLLS
jgi:hypothetical protein